MYWLDFKEQWNINLSKQAITACLFIGRFVGDDGAACCPAYWEQYVGQQAAQEDIIHLSWN